MLLSNQCYSLILILVSSWDKLLIFCTILKRFLKTIFFNLGFPPKLKSYALVQRRHHVFRRCLDDACYCSGHFINGHPVSLGHTLSGRYGICDGMLYRYHLLTDNGLLLDCWFFSLLSQTTPSTTCCFGPKNTRRFFRRGATMATHPWRVVDWKAACGAVYHPHIECRLAAHMGSGIHSSRAVRGSDGRSSDFAPSVHHHFENGRGTLSKAAGRDG